MSKILNVQLSDKSTKPIFTTITPADRQIKCLLDTGADMPVWCGSEGLLKIVFPKVELIDKKFLLGGFGRKAEIVDVYKIPKFFIRSEEDVLAFQNLYVASSFDRNFGCDLIVSATMFNHMDYSILNRKGSYSILRIEYDRDVYYTQMVLNQQCTGIADRIFSFASETAEEKIGYMAEVYEMSEMKERLHTGELYLPGDEAIMKEQMVYQDKLCDYNMTKPSETAKRAAMLKEMLGDCGEGVYIEAPFYANFGGHHCHFGKMVYANYHLTCVDDTHIYIGDYTMIGPNVTIATAGHPILPELREQLYQYNMPVHIGRNCWIGAGAIIMPGVTVGDNTVIGAGSVVTKDIPANVVAVGNPCRVMREIGEHDKEYYFKDRKM